ncbi:MAG: phage DNA encapsidation protein [Eubacteriales bacterium]|nr:phage DNA encapsidation protein [Eubacteriales bacterium]
MDINKEYSTKIAKAIDSSNQWYTVKSILGYWWAIFYILLGAREAGKSFSVMDFFLSEYFNKGKEFIWLRLTEASTKKLLNNNAMQFIDIALMNKYGINSKDLKTKGNTVFYKNKPMARILALSTFYSDKGVAHFEDKDFADQMFAYNICCDEFQRERNEKNTFDITYAFVNQLENLVRHKTNCRIFLIGNTVEECSDILTLFNFIPEAFGRYKLKKKRCVIDYIPPSKKYLERRKGSIASILAPDASTFTNEQKYDRSKIYKGRVYKPQFIIQFRNQSFTVWDKNVILRHNKENKPIISMVPLLINNTVFKSELRDEVILMNYEKKFMFRDLLTQKLFDKCIKEIKGIKG